MSAEVREHLNVYNARWKGELASSPFMYNNIQSFTKLTFLARFVGAFAELRPLTSSYLSVRPAVRLFAMNSAHTGRIFIGFDT